MSQNEVQIRQATIADVQTIAELHIKSWQWAYRGLLPDDHLDHRLNTLNERAADYRERLSNLSSQKRWWVVEQDSDIIGFAMTGPSRDRDALPSTGEVSALHVAQQAVGKGIGRTLFTRALAELKRQGYAEATLWVLEGNGRARRFYELAGWSLDGASKTEEMAKGAFITQVRYRFPL